MRPLAVLSALCVIAVPACRPADTAPTTAPKGIPVETVLVASEDVDVTVEAVGTLRADQTVQLEPKRPGHVRQLRVIEGARVEEGDVLVVLDDDALRAQVDLARASLSEAVVREQNARRQHERTIALHKKGVASQQELDDATAELDRADATVEVARAGVAFAEAQLADTVIRAPFAGVLGQRFVDLGAFVKDGEPIATLVDLDPVEAVVAVPERYLSQLRLGHEVRAMVVSHSDRAFSGAVTFIDPQVDPINRTVTVKAVIPNVEGVLRPGQFTTIELHLSRHPQMPVIPEEAVVPDGDRSLVFVVDNGNAAAREIETGVRLPGRVEVVNGLKAGEKIVRAGHEKLRLGEALPVLDTAAQVGG